MTFIDTRVPQSVVEVFALATAFIPDARLLNMESAS